MKEGDKVRYCPAYTLKEEPDVAWVVYHCDNDWENYRNYTGAQTKLTDLKPGWK